MIRNRSVAREREEEPWRSRARSSFPPRPRRSDERCAVVREVEPGERLVLDWDDEGRVVFTLEEVPEGTRISVREVSGEWSTALELRACALAWTAA
jgi:uncharacterized protein YndB with AHSA1/START domain